MYLLHVYKSSAGSFQCGGVRLFVYLGLNSTETVRDGCGVCCWHVLGAWVLNQENGRCHLSPSEKCACLISCACFANLPGLFLSQLFTCANGSWERPMISTWWGTHCFLVFWLFTSLSSFFLLLFYWFISFYCFALAAKPFITVISQRCYKLVICFLGLALLITSYKHKLATYAFLKVSCL